MDVINEKPRKLYRSRNKKIGGVCQGIADYFNMDVTVVRLIAVLALLFVGGGLLAYLLLWIFIPLEPLYLEKHNDYDNGQR